ncbi:uncharacterized protein LOC129741998 [Uranotaenia lowii]|uniref:uncharacterized protein LOC129741998 n=1 Tax=Uranotaenia lowii TaxID=190385 RepID=UPI0024794AFF|nr:uncharacterized protein LOC129741998 [Uranotaenia lowii]
MENQPPQHVEGALAEPCGLCEEEGKESSAVTFPFYSYVKSFRTGLRECAKYYEVSDCDLNRYIQDSFPETDVVKKLVRCALVNLAAWDDASGVLDNVIRNYFHPVPEDTCYHNRTQDCISKALGSCNSLDQFSKAYLSFQCYFNQYGNLLTDEDRFIPYAPYEVQELAVNSLVIADLSQCVLKQHALGNIIDEPHFPSLLLAHYLHSVYYTSRDGIQLEILYDQYGNKELLTPETHQCVEAAQAAPGGSHHSDKLYRIFSRCLQHIVPTLQELQDGAASLIVDDQDCGCDVCTQTPFYNRV